MQPRSNLFLENDMKQIKDMNDLMGVITERPRYTSGIPVGIIAIDLEYPKLPGNVVNALSLIHI